MNGTARIDIPPIHTVALSDFIDRELNRAQGGEPENNQDENENSGDAEEDNEEGANDNNQA